MQWKNLSHFKCPHCGQPLLRREEEKEIVCSRCRFIITEERFESIKANRNDDHGVIVRMKWQRLHDNRCPICDSPMRLDHSLNRCSGKNCKFAIGQYKLENILKDQGHPANRFNRPVAELDKIINI